jgi:hypothetical protein
MNATEDLPLQLVAGAISATERVVKSLDKAPPQESSDKETALEQQYGAEALVAHCLRLAKDSRQLWESTWARAEAGHVHDFDKMGELLDDVLDRCALVQQEVAVGVKTLATHLGIEIAGLAELESALPAFQAWSRKALSAWPRPARFRPKFDAAKLARSREQAARGEHEAIEDVLARVEAGGPLVAE